MRHGIGRLDTLLLAAGCIGLFFWTLAGARPADRCAGGLCQMPGASTSEHGSPAPPFPRYHIGFVNGKPGDLADLKPGSELSDANLRSANWRGVNLGGVTLRGVDLRGADLRGTDLRTTFADGYCLPFATDVSDARLDGADLTGACYDTDTRWPAGFDPRTHGARLVE
jgi:hypothetical protein